MLKFKIDGNLPAEVAALLAGAGHDAQQRMGGRADPDIADLCQRENRAIVTLDLDFADIRAYPPVSYSGIIVLRLARLDTLRILSVVQRLLPLFGKETLAGKLWIVEESRVRIHE